jgi:hypothetical protein
MTHPGDESIVAIAKMPGVADLPTMQKGKFAQALRLEAKGTHDEAAVKLNEAIAAGGNA